LTSNIRLGCKWLSMINRQAYNIERLTTTLRSTGPSLLLKNVSFIKLTQGVHFI
jgi:hypothetical protein